MITNHLNPNEYNAYYKTYINNATAIDIVEGLEKNLDSVVSFYRSIPSIKYNYAYADGKWTIKDVLLHIIDTERIFAYRVLRIARQDKTPLVGFEQDAYVESGNATSRNIEDLLAEYKAVRQATIVLYKSFDSSVLEEIGEASGFSISVRALGYIITGHENHHNQVIEERYL